jgi:surface protein
LSINWNFENDTNAFVNVKNGKQEHKYNTVGNHIVVIRGELHKFGDEYICQHNLKRVHKFSQYLIDLSRAFNGAGKLVEVPEKISENVTNMSFMFANCRTFNQSLANWDVSHVTNMHAMFLNCTTFNQPLANWDVSYVTNMSCMFTYCRSFNQPLANWDVSHVTDMSYMFYYCTIFNQPLANWYVSHVTDMSYMFYNCPIDEKTNALKHNLFIDQKN